MVWKNNPWLGKLWSFKPLLAMGYFTQPSDLEWFNAFLQFPTSTGELNAELLHKQRVHEPRDRFLFEDATWSLAADWLIRCKQKSLVADRQSCDQSCVWAGGGNTSAFNQSASRRRIPNCRNKERTATSCSVPELWAGARLLGTASYLTWGDAVNTDKSMAS